MNSACSFTRAAAFVSKCVITMNESSSSLRAASSLAKRCSWSSSLLPPLNSAMLLGYPKSGR